MKMDLETLARIVEERVPTARATCVPEANQIVVKFINRPEVEVALLTPWLQTQMRKNDVDSEELFKTISDVKRISETQTLQASDIQWTL